MASLIHGPVCPLCMCWIHLGPNTRLLCVDSKTPGAIDHSELSRAVMNASINYLTHFWGNSVPPIHLSRPKED